MSQSLTAAVRQLRRSVAGDETDAALLGRYAARQDADAFAALLGRYRGLVFGVCRRVLGHEHDAEDATQATFLLLARKADSLRRGESLPGWLHGTARYVALRARRDAQRRRTREDRAARPLLTDPADE